MEHTPSPPPEPKLPLRVLFLHGLESKAWGAKSTVLKKRVAETVQSIQMPVSELRKPWGRNHAMSAFAALVMLFIAGVLVGTFILVAPTKQVMLGSSKAALVAASFGVSALCAPLSLLALQSAMRFIVEECYAMQEATIAEFGPDIIVASSFGGAIAQLLLARGAWSGPTLLLAPAGEKIMQWYNVARHAFMCTVCCGAPDIKAPPLDPDEDEVEGGFDAVVLAQEVREAMYKLKAARLTAELKVDTVPVAIQLPPFSGRAAPPPRILLVHSVNDAVVPLSHSLAWALAPQSSAWVHCVTVLNDSHALRHTCSAENLRVWLGALSATEGGAGVEGGWAAILPDTMLADVLVSEPESAAGAASSGHRREPWAKRFQDASEG